MGVVPPVQQRVAPAGVRDVAGRPLREVPVDVADHVAHVAVVVLGRVPAAEDLDDPTARGVADRLGAAVRLEADRQRLLGAKPRLELVGVEVDRLLELERDSLQLLGTHQAAVRCSEPWRGASCATVLSRRTSAGSRVAP